MTLYMQMYLESWKYMFLRRSLASLAQYKYIIFVGTFGGPCPPPQYQKAGYALLTRSTIRISIGLGIGITTGYGIRFVFQFKVGRTDISSMHFKKLVVDQIGVEW